MVRGREEAARKKEIRGGHTTSVVCPKSAEEIIKSSKH